ncbi:MAG: alpha/beta hydrolase [Pseudomonadota bacterium]|nr:alpha/beta hydrolase [Pseudomonadota bacterium]
MTLNDHGHISVGDAALEYRMIGPRPDAAPTIVMLHEGLGSVTTWGEFPDKLAECSGCGVFVYARAGYGNSSPVPLPRPLDYMQRESTETLPNLLDAIGFKRGLLLGHSDGASIAAHYAGTHQDHRVNGVVLIAPHFFTEAPGLAEIANTRAVYETTDLPGKLARHHANVEVAFRGWNDAWLDPKFATDFDLTSALAYIRVPILVIQGAADRYGTLAQVRVVEDECYCPVETLILPGCGHAPQREEAPKTLAAITAFSQRLFHADAQALDDVIRFTPL